MNGRTERSDDVFKTGRVAEATQYKIIALGNPTLSFCCDALTYFLVRCVLRRTGDGD